MKISELLEDETHDDDSITMRLVKKLVDKGQTVYHFDNSVFFTTRTPRKSQIVDVKDVSVGGHRWARFAFANGSQQNARMDTGDDEYDLRQDKDCWILQRIRLLSADGEVLRGKSL